MAFTDEFYAAAMSISANQELRDTLADPQIPVDRKQAIVDELLGPVADGVVVAGINFLIAAGQAKHLESIASKVAELAAAEEGSVVAEVRSAVPSVIGGIVAQVGDTVFDGSVKSRFEDLREQWG